MIKKTSILLVPCIALAGLLGCGTTTQEKDIVDTETASKSADNELTSDKLAADELLDLFIDGSICAHDLENPTSTFYITDLDMSSDEWDSYTVREKIDLDNDGENELFIDGPYGGMFLDARNDEVYVFAQGDGTGCQLSYVNSPSGTWILYSNTTHSGYHTYNLEKYDGADQLVDTMDLYDQLVNGDNPYAGCVYFLNDREVSILEYSKAYNEIFGCMPTCISADLSYLFDGVNGCLVLYDPNSDCYTVYNEDMAYTRYSPYSTFKIVSTLMGLKNNVLADANATMHYNGTTYPIDAWNQNLTLEQAFQSSCVWYFRQAIDAVGQDEVQQELSDLRYGNCDISEWAGSNTNPGDDLNGFWLDSSLQIAPLEQVCVLQRIFEDSSLYSTSETDLLKSIMLYDSVNGYSIYGKTGTCQNSNGWYVGLIENGQSTCYFAVYVESDNPDHPATGAVAREIIKTYVTEEL